MLAAEHHAKRGGKPTRSTTWGGKRYDEPQLFIPVSGIFTFASRRQIRLDALTKGSDVLMQLLQNPAAWNPNSGRKKRNCQQNSGFTLKFMLFGK